MTAAADPMVLASDEITRAAAASQPLSAHAVDGDLRVDILANGCPVESVVVTATTVRLLADVLARLAAGQIVTLIPQHAELTVRQAADALLVSPPFVAKLIDQGSLPSRVIGGCPLIRYDDLLAYKRRADAEAEEGMRELTREGEALGLYR